MAEQDDSSLFREIDEELREEQFTKLWKSYGKYVVGVAVLVVIVVAGYQGWQGYDAGRKAESGAALAEALEQADAGDIAGASERLNALALEGRSGHALLARFRAASLLAEEGNMEAAASAYRAIAEDSDTDTLYQGLALVLEATTTLAGGASADLGALDSRLSAINTAASPWRYSARELMALIAMKNGDTARAQDLLDGLSTDATTPESLRRRAADLRQTL